MLFRKLKGLLKRILRLLKYLPVIFRLSPPGRRLIKEILSRKSKAEGFSSLRNIISAYIYDKKDRTLLLECFMRADRYFSSKISGSVPGGKKDLLRLYARLLPHGFTTSWLRNKIFNAFDIELSNEQKDRVILFAFIQRIYDDVLDEGMAEKEELSEILFLRKVPDRPELKTLWLMTGLLLEIAPLDEYPNFYRMVLQAHELQTAKTTAGNASELTVKKAENNMTLNSLIVLDQLPGDIVRISALLGRWLQYFDDLVDYESDTAEGIFTSVNTSDDPEAVLRESASACIAYLREHSARPDSLIHWIEKTTDLGWNIYKKRIDFEALLCFNID